MRLPLPMRRAPRRHRANRFTLMRQELDHNALDYAAVMRAREHLRAWSHSDWPQDGFTLEDNASDLRMHMDDAETGFAYGFTVFPLAREAVWGSVYVNPIQHFARFYHLDERARSVFEAAVAEIDYWLLPELEADPDFHVPFVVELETWLLHEWGFTQPLFGSRPQMHPRRKIYQAAGLDCVLELDATTPPPRKMWLHGRKAATTSGDFSDPLAGARSV